MENLKIQFESELEKMLIDKIVLNYASEEERHKFQIGDDNDG